MRFHDPSAFLSRFWSFWIAVNIKLILTRQIRDGALKTKKNNRVWDI